MLLVISVFNCCCPCWTSYCAALGLPVGVGVGVGVGAVLPVGFGVEDELLLPPQPASDVVNTKAVVTTMAAVPPAKNCRLLRS